MASLLEILGRERERQPIGQNVPSATASFQRKWGNLGPVAQSFGGALKPLIDIDAQRVGRGQFPISARQTAYALMASVGNKAVATPDAGFHPIKNTLSDARKLLTGFVRLPWTIAREIEELPQAPAEISAALKQPGLGAKVAGVAGAHGVRFLPGSYIAQELGSGNAGELANHPLLAALDVLPYANKGMKVAGVEGGVRGALSKVSEETKLGQGVNEKLNELGIGRAPHDIARQTSIQGRILHSRMAELEPLYNQLAEGLSETDRVRAYEVGTMGRKPEEMATLTEPQREFANTVHELNQYRAAIESEAGNIVQVGEELYSKEEARPMLAARKKQEAAAERAAKMESTIARREGALYKRAQRLGAMGDKVPDAPTGEVLDARLREIELMESHFRGQPKKGPGNRAFVGEKAGFVQARQLFAQGEYAKAANAAKRGLKVLETAAAKPGGEGITGIIDHLRDTPQMFKDLADFERLNPVMQAGYEKFTDLESKLNDRKAARREALATAEEHGATFAELQQRTPPKRFFPLVNERFKELATEAALNKQIEGMTPPELADDLADASMDLRDMLSEEEIADIRENVVPARDLTRGEINRVWKEAAGEWLRMRDELGLDPVYAHSVSAEQASLIQHPTLFPASINTPTQYRSASRFAKPAVQDFVISMKHADFERFRADAQTKIAEHIGGAYATTMDNVIAKYRPVAEAMHLSGKFPALTIDGITEVLIAEKYARWKPEELFPEQRARVTAPFQIGEGDMVVPNHVLKTLKSFYPKDYNALFGVFDKGTKLWTTFLLPFSPRFHLYNIVGGAISTSVKTSPIAVLKYFNEARKMVKDGTLPVEISRGMGMLPADALTEATKVGAVLGNKWAELKAAKALTKWADWAFEKNGIVDNFYRSIAYLYGENKGGIGSAKGHLEGVKLANKVLQDWDSMLPMERTLLRPVIPFYGWMKHILRFTLSLPVDHPLRVSIMANMGRAEIEDFGTALPEQLLSLVPIPFMGHEKAGVGTQWMVSLRGANPFADVANYFTLAGFVSNLNPFLEAGLQSMGVNPATGKPQSYGQQVYNPLTGRAETKTPGLAYSIATSIIPLLEPALAGLGVGEGANLAKLDPDAAQQRMLSRLGFPTALKPKPYNLRKEAAVAELSRLQIQDQAYNNALRTGQYRGAMRYPNLRARLVALGQLPPDLLAMYALNRNVPQLTE